jgi:hypothetical protein
LPQAKVAAATRLRQQDDLAGVHRKVFDDVIDGFEYLHVVPLNLSGLDERFFSLGSDDATRLVNRRCQLFQ